MEEGRTERPKRTDAYNNVIRAGKRMYFVDVRTTPEEELCVIITESKKCTDNEGHFFYEKHKIYIYPEDLENFLMGLSHVSGFLKNKRNHSVIINKYNSKNFERSEKENQVSEPFEDKEEDRFSVVEKTDLEEQK